MDNQVGGDLKAGTTAIEHNIEEKQMRDVKETDMQEVAVEAEEKQRPESSSQSSSDDDVNVKKLDSRIVKVRDSLEGDAAFAHLPEHEQAILKKQLDIPTVAINYIKLYRYATRVDLIIIAISSLCAIIGGAVLPLMTVSILFV